MDKNTNIDHPLTGIVYLWLCRKAREARLLGLHGIAQSIRDRADWILANRKGQVSRRS